MNYIRKRGYEERENSQLTRDRETERNTERKDRKKGLIKT